MHSYLGGFVCGCSGLFRPRRQGPRRSTGRDRITHEVRHELVMLPYYGVFDNKDLANIRASAVSGVLSVVNNLRVEK
jgi:hypothetical protein